MADRVFKGRLITTGDIHDENRRAFPEASEDFRNPHKGGLSPYQMIYDILKFVEEFQPALPHHLPVKVIGDSIWISDNNSWIKIDADGTVEIGTSGQ